MRLLVVGGRLQGVEAAYLAKKAGFWARVVDKAPVVPAMGLGDAFVQADVTSPEGLERAADGIDLILPAMENGPALRSLCKYAPHLGIPLAFDPEAYAISRSKLITDRLLARHHIPAPLAWPDCGFPAVVKPSAGSGSEGVRVLIDADARNQDFGAEFPPEGMVVQQHLSGPSYSVEVIGKPGCYRVLPATALEMDGRHDCKRVLAPAGLNGDALRQLAAIGRACAEAIQLTGIMDVEVIRHESAFKVIEIDARLPSQTPTAVLHSSGINQVALLGALFLEGDCAICEPEASQRGVVFEHIRVADHRLNVCGEHIMAAAAPLRHEVNFFGADEALTTFEPEADTWVATLIIFAENRQAAWRKHERVMTRLTNTLGLIVEDPSPEIPGGLRTADAEGMP
jgi:pyrrolysine biosynthesis protein PylC